MRKQMLDVRDADLRQGDRLLGGLRLDEPWRASMEELMHTGAHGLHTGRAKVGMREQWCGVSRAVVRLVHANVGH